MDSFVIFVVGPAASGKSTLAAAVQRGFPAFRFVTDLVALKELAQINDRFHSLIAIQQRARGRSFGEHLGGLQSPFWAQRLACKIAALAAGALRPEHLETVRTPDGGFRILDPSVWDDALSQTIALLEDGHSYVVEFARGTDTTYLEYHGISSAEVYCLAFESIRSSNPLITPDRSLIIHVSAERSERERRNHLRRCRGEHYVS